MTPYREGFEQGYQDVSQDGTQGDIWAHAFAQAKGHGEPILTPTQESDWWLGYYHGRHYARTGRLPHERSMS